MSLKIRGVIPLVAISVSVGLCFAQSSEVDDALSGSASPVNAIPPELVIPVTPVAPIVPIAPIAPRGTEYTSDKKWTGVDWSALLRESFAFLSLEHGFRYLTEQGTRYPHTPFFKGYVDSVSNLHGWSDGDPFIVNYVGHPMQGAVTGFLWAENDRKYRMVEFGENRWYWKSRLRAAAYSWAYSEQFEIGALSEASLGHVQAFFPQQGFVDQVATPAIGLGWMIVEDALDKYVIRRVEAHTTNGVVRMFCAGRPESQPQYGQRDVDGAAVASHRSHGPLGTASRLPFERQAAARARRGRSSSDRPAV
jgi:hypothetical protein